MFAGVARKLRTARVAVVAIGVFDLACLTFAINQEKIAFAACTLAFIVNCVTIRDRYLLTLLCNLIHNVPLVAKSAFQGIFHAVLAFAWAIFALTAYQGVFLFTI